MNGVKMYGNKDICNIGIFFFILNNYVFLILFIIVLLIL